jgi:actin related protein 2/3 complex subunit 2
MPTEDKQALVTHLALFKRSALSAPFLAAFAEQSSLQANYKDAAGAQRMDTQTSETKGSLMTINYREQEAIFIQASNDRVTVIFSTVFKEETDRVYGKVFLQVCGGVWLGGETCLAIPVVLDGRPFTVYLAALDGKQD